MTRYGRSWMEEEDGVGSLDSEVVVPVAGTRGRSVW